jgi:hypothetical protein
MTPSLPLQILCFMHDIINVSMDSNFDRSSTRFQKPISSPISNQGLDLTSIPGGISSALEFKAKLRVYIGEDTGFCDRIDDLSRFGSVDKLITFIEDVGDLFQNPTDLSPNAVVAPVVLMVDSYLGVYVRRLLLNLEAYSFEAMCSLFSELQIYHGQSANSEAFFHDEFEAMNASRRGCSSQDTAISVEDNNEIESIPLLSSTLMASVHGLQCKANPHLSFSSTSGGPESLRSAQAAVRDMDMPHAESIIHGFFDTVAGLARVERGVDYNIFDIPHAPGPSVGPHEANRHQHALLNLSSAAAQTSHLDQALMAVEEAIKVAHQRGDHASVAQSLLLMYFIMKRMSTLYSSSASIDDKDLSVYSSQLRDSSENVLLRCINQSFFVSIPKLTFQASLALVEHMVDNDFLLQSLGGKFQVDNLWNLLHAVKARDLCATQEQIKRIGISSPSQLSSPVTYVEVLSSLDHLILQIQACGTGTLVWLKFGMPYMAINTLKRGLRLFLRFPTLVLPRDVVDILLSFVGKLAILIASACVLDSALQEVKAFAEGADTKTEKHVATKTILSVATHLIDVASARFLAFASAPSANAFRLNVLIARLLISLNDRCDSSSSCELLVAMFGPASRPGICVRMISAFLSLRDKENSLALLNAIEAECVIKGYNEELAMCLVMKGILYQEAGAVFSNQMKTESILSIDSGLSIDPRETSVGLRGIASVWLEYSRPDALWRERMKKLCVSVVIESLLMQ